MALQLVTAIWGNKYSEDYVKALKRQVPDLKVVRVGNGLLEPQRYTGWWCKLEIFRPENAHLRPCLFIDLDTYVLGDLEPFFELDYTKLWLIRAFFDPKRSNSGLFIAPENVDEIWEKAKNFNLDHGNRSRGDGDFLSEFPHEILQDSVSGIMSYKADELHDDPKNARICCFHGKPKPHETTGWAKEFWTTMTN